MPCYRSIVASWVMAIAFLDGGAHADEAEWSSQSQTSPAEELSPAAGTATVESTTEGEEAPELLEPAPPPAADSGESSLIDGVHASILDLDDDDSKKHNRILHGSVSYTYISGSGDDFGLFSIESQQRDANPFKDTAVTYTQPGWGVIWLNGPNSTDLPPQLYQFTLPIEVDAVNNVAWTLSLMITPSWFTDGENRRPEMFRLPGAVTAYYRQDDSTQFGLGLLYLDREDIPALPLFGVVFGGADDPIRYELIFPRPRVVWTFADTPHSTGMAYLSGELGGGSYAIKRPDRTPDVVTLRDLRLVAGLELEDHLGHQAAIEVGWVFDRAIESHTGRGDYDPPVAFMARLRFEY